VLSVEPAGPHPEYEVMMSTGIRVVPTARARGRLVQTALKPPPGATVTLVTDTAMDGWHPWGSSRLITLPVWLSTSTDPWMVVPVGTDVRFRMIRSVTPGTGVTSPPHSRAVPCPVQ